MNPNVKVNNTSAVLFLFFFSLSSSLLVRVQIHCYFSTFGKLMSGIHLVRRYISNINEVYGEEFFFWITGGEYNRGYKKNKVFLIESNINKQWNRTVWRWSRPKWECSRRKLECSRSKLECNGCLYLLQSKSNSDKRRTLAYLIKFDWWFAIYMHVMGKSSVHKQNICAYII